MAADPHAYPLETPVRTAPAHRFVAAANGARGLAVLAPGFFEYEWTVRGDLVLTLLRAVGELSRKGAELAANPQASLVFPFSSSTSLTFSMREAGVNGF